MKIMIDNILYFLLCVLIFYLGTKYFSSIKLNKYKYEHGIHLGDIPRVGGLLFYLCLLTSTFYLKYTTVWFYILTIEFCH